MILIIILVIYGVLLAAWALFSLLSIFNLLKYQPISLTGWLAIVIYFLAAASLLTWTWSGISPLIDLSSLSLPTIPTIPNSF